MHHLQRKQCTTNSGMDAQSQTVTMHHGQRSACTIRCGVFMERRILVKLLYEKRNDLIREGRFTDAIDELILKIIDAKGC